MISIRVPSSSGLFSTHVFVSKRNVLQQSNWQVDDDSTVQLMEQFYNQLKEPGVTKAEALHRAQQALLKDLHYQNPSSWAPYILVGNWR